MLLFTIYLIFDDVNNIIRGDKMAKNNLKEKNMSVPIENHETAAWANIERTKLESNVFLPSEFAVEDAKDYVEENQK